MRNMVIFDTALGTSNVGDEIIMDAVCRNMRSQFDCGFSLRLATHVNNFSAKQVIRAGNKVKYFQKADWKFVCGTNLISQKRIGKVNSQWQLYPSNLSVYDNCILIGAGTTQKTQKLDFYARLLYKKVLSKEYIHSVRDDLTKSIIESLGCRAINTGCPTLWELTAEHCKKIPTGRSQACIFSVSGFADQKDKKQDQEMLDILRSNYRDLWAWIQTIDDENYLKTLNGSEGIPRVYSLSHFRRLLQEKKPDYIGTRLHGGVFALQNGCRSIVISIDHRAEGFHETNNLPILRRQEISTLENRINSDWSTEIRINEQAIEKFKSQFV